jgi:hypothetical protein
VFLGPVDFEALTIAAIDEMSGVGEARGAALRVSLRVGGHLLEHRALDRSDPFDIFAVPFGLPLVQFLK